MRIVCTTCLIFHYDTFDKIQQTIYSFTTLRSSGRLVLHFKQSIIFVNTFEPMKVFFGFFRISLEASRFVTHPRSWVKMITRSPDFHIYFYAKSLINDFRTSVLTFRLQRPQSPSFPTKDINLTTDNLITRLCKSGVLYSLRSTGYNESTSTAGARRKARVSL